MSSSASDRADATRHLFVLHLHVEMLKIINVVWCNFQDFKFKVKWSSIFFLVTSVLDKTIKYIYSNADLFITILAASLHEADGFSHDQ